MIRNETRLLFYFLKIHYDMCLPTPHSKYDWKNKKIKMLTKINDERKIQKI